MNFIKTIGIILLTCHCLTVNAGEKEKSESIEIVKSIIGVCKEKGMLACEPNMKGVDLVFEYIRLFDQVSQLDIQFNELLKTRYPKEQGLDFDVIQASLNLSLDITFTPEQLVSKVTGATKKPNGYDVVIGGGRVLQLRKTDNIWIVIFPQEVAAQFKQLEPYYTAGRLKRSILIYRMLEADMANLDKDQVEENVSKDIAPILVALFGKRKTPTILKWLVNDISEVIKFYSPFTTTEDMKAHIIKTHGLS